MDVEIGIRNDWKYFNMDWAMDRAETLAQVSGIVFPGFAKQQHQSSRGWEYESNE